MQWNVRIRSMSGVSFGESEAVENFLAGVVTGLVAAGRKVELLDYGLWPLDVELALSTERAAIAVARRIADGLRQEFPRTRMSVAVTVDINRLTAGGLA
jgi:hypothetical protein